MNSLAHNIKIIINGDVQIHGALPGDTVPPSFTDDELLGEIVKQKPEITYNTERTHKSGRKAPNGIEIRFGTARPTESVRQELKDHGFQFSERQTMWYAIDNAQSRTLAEKWADEEVEVDTTQYEKRNFWARVSSMRDYENLRERTEFYVKTEPPKNFYSKSYLQRAYNISDLIDSGKLYFKKFYNKVVGEDDPGGETPDNNEPDNDEADSNNQDHIAIAEKLEALADGMQKEIDSKINSPISRQRPTARRMRIAAGMREEGYKLQELQSVLYALAEAHRAGTISDFPYLQKIRSKSHIALFNKYADAIKHSWGQDYIQRTYDHYREDLQKWDISSVYDWSLADGQKSDLLARYAPAVVKKHRENEKRIKELEMEIIGRKIPGFFPAPLSLIERLLSLADLNINQTILEPSAGKGDILDAIANRFSNQMPLFAVELNSTLREILILKGYNLIGTDFLQIKDKNFDRIVMNPPFENGQDVEHVMHALELLNSDGRVVAIMSEGVFFRQFKKDVAFRKLLMEKNAYISEPIKEAFKDGFNSTGVAVRIVAINADGTPIAASQSSARSDSSEAVNHKNEDMELLQLEAEAELELLKMRVELERKRKQRSVDGVPGIDPDKLQRFRRKAWALQDNVEILDYN